MSSLKVEALHREFFYNGKLLTEISTGKSEKCEGT